MIKPPEIQDAPMPSRPSEEIPAVTSRTRRPALWRSLEELAGDESFGALLEDEFAGVSLQWLDEASRRRFLKLMGASLALSGIAGCAVQPEEKIVPYVQPPEDVIPGRPLFFATALAPLGSAVGVLVESHMGRPIKIEGNPAHPASLGATDMHVQASILQLYDPDRSQVILDRGRVDTWDRFLAAAVDLRTKKVAEKGKGLRILTRGDAALSPTLSAQLRKVLEAFPEARWHAYEPVGREAVREGTRRAFGEALEPVYHLDKADVVVALDADFLTSGPASLRYARDHASRREPGTGDSGATMNRLYAAEATPSLTGSAADHRLPLASKDVEGLARELAHALKLPGAAAAEPGSKHAAWIAAVAKDLEAHKGRGLVVAGETQPAEVHVLAHLINDALGNHGRTVTFYPAPEPGPAGRVGSLADLVGDIKLGKVDTLLILGANPMYDAPADLEFAAVMTDTNVPTRIHLGLYDDETAAVCHWHLPESHPLEAWGDLVAFDGTATIQQPLIAPLYQGHSAIEVLAILLGQPGRPGQDIVKSTWREKKLPGDFDAAWKDALRRGIVPGTTAEPKAVTLKSKDVPPPGPAKPADQGLEIVFRPDPAVWDGTFANSGWLQELPKPLTRFTWDNAALISPAEAERRGIANEDVLVLRYRGRALTLPAWILPGQAEGTITVSLGYGRTRAGHVGNGAGANAYALRTSDAPWHGAGLELSKTGEKRKIAIVQHHYQMQGREPIKVGTAEEFRADPGFAHEHHAPEAHGESLYPDAPRGQDAENAWGMTIDLNKCIGCGTCVVACQAENNIPIVGKEEVLRSREMHWLRIDRYYEGDEKDPQAYFQPVPCMHCEKAPCEPVCPVGATTHSDEGLNEMTYNRCVGTRYCGNNCPYKVRRFNFFQYADLETPSLKLLNNPDVTVRTRGVMEKCSYCVQRINEARIVAKMEGRPVGGDEVKTACQAACSCQAIVFGNLLDPNSAVAKSKASPRNYALLEELNTLPRTTYLAKLRNPNPELEAEPKDRHESNHGNS
ncbi:TAT-variant-translocated molybdopterin oxidoreductase [Aquisphaera insulae]|uniref:TAT-variant-translocated molybdopterin oxidoreductase n=1 Tax=Aquisphaera insulae TaxID=2712864 RepID=UPI00196B98C2|nr:TAT-variant-translocated molybdopterin oxidoreductase [Aquisphaera insulae]